MEDVVRRIDRAHQEADYSTDKWEVIKRVSNLDVYSPLCRVDDTTGPVQVEGKEPAADGEGGMASEAGMGSSRLEERVMCERLQKIVCAIEKGYREGGYSRGEWVVIKRVSNMNVYSRLCKI